MMTEHVQQAIRPLQEIERWQTALRLTRHDRQLMMNNPVVYNLATYMVQFMGEYGTHIVSAAFRAACAMYSDWERQKVWEEANDAYADTPEGK